jgi:hypothetical protein
MRLDAEAGVRACAAGTTEARGKAGQPLYAKPEPSARLIHTGNFSTI